MIFSCSLLHEATPVTRGRRYAFVPFFYDQAKALLRECRQIHFADGRADYRADRVEGPDSPPPSTDLNLNPPDMAASGHVKSAASRSRRLWKKRETDDAVRAPGNLDDRRGGGVVRRADLAAVRGDLRAWTSPISPPNRPSASAWEAALARQHDYTARVEWTGNRGDGTRSYRGYDRTWDVATPGKPVIHCSNDPLLGGDPALPNPEDLLLASLSACHMLWYLHLASAAGIVVLSYQDNPIGVGETSPDGAGRFLSATLKPHIIVEAGADLAEAEAIHNRIHQYCFIARSVNFPVRYEPTFTGA